MSEIPTGQKTASNGSILVLIIAPLIVTVVGGLLVEYIKPVVNMGGDRSEASRKASITAPSKPAGESTGRPFRLQHCRAGAWITGRYVYG